MKVISTTVQPEQVAAESVEKVEASEAATAEAEKQAETTAEDSESEEQEEEEKAEEEEEKPAEESQEEKPKPVKGFKKRIDKLTKRASLAEQERDALRVQLEQMRAGSATAKETPKEAKGEPKADDYDTHDAYVRALTKWEVAQANKEREEKQKLDQDVSERQKLANRYNEGKEAIKKKYSDYDDVIEAVEDVVVPGVLREVILQSENGAELAYHLAKNPKEFERICSLPAVAAVREFGKFEASLQKPAETKKTTKAPEPINPVGKGGTAAPKKTIWDADLTQAEYEALRAKQRAKKGA